MKKIYVAICILAIMSAIGHAQLTRQPQQDLDGFYTYFTSNTPLCVISTATSNYFGTVTPDWYIQNYATNTYNIQLSTTVNMRDAYYEVAYTSNIIVGNVWTLTPGQGISPKEIMRYAPIFIRNDPATAPVTALQRVQVIKNKFVTMP